MKIEELIDRGDETGQRIRETLNVLLESPYFYKTDDERLFLVLTRYKRAFESFFDKFFGWTLVMDAKCARLYKPKWFNEKITLPNRMTAKICASVSATGLNTRRLASAR